MNAVLAAAPAGFRLLRRSHTLIREWIAGRLTTRQVIRIAMRVTRFERWGVRPVTEARFRALIQTSEQSEYFRAAGEVALGMSARNVALTTNLEQARVTINHLRRVEAAYHKSTAVAEENAAQIRRVEAAYRQATERAEQNAADLRRTEAAYHDAAELAAQSATELTRLRASKQEIEATARRGVQAIMNEWQRILFEVTGNTGPTEAATTLVLGDQPVADSLATLVNLSEASHGARPFQYAMPILARSRPFPLPWPAVLPPLRIVDVGSQELDTERDLHAPLRAGAPVEIIGFDPFASPGEADPGAGDTSFEVVRSDGSKIRTFPMLLADGADVAFHINRFDATSSILASNHQLTRQFGLLDLAVETVDTRTLPSHRMDDVLPVEGEAARIDLLKIDVQGAAHTLLDNAAKVLGNTLVCHVEIEFAPVYVGEKLFGEVDALLRAAGFCFVDFFSLGRQRYASFDISSLRAFHRGRTLWGDCIYIRGLDTPGALSKDDLFRAAFIAHGCYNKQDLAAELLGRIDNMAGTTLLKDYVSGADIPDNPS